MLDKYIGERIFLYDIPGLAVSIRRGEYLFEKAYGYADYENKVPMKTDSVFHCASITKVLTAKACMDFDIKAKVKDILPWLEINEDITVEMLLSHTSGLGDETDWSWERADVSEDALVKYLLSSPPKNLRIPGERFIYSNVGYDILGAVISELSGVSYEKYVEERIFNRLGMKSASLITPLRNDRENMAVPHIKDEKKHIVKSAAYPYTREHGPSSCLTSHIDDIGVLADYCMNNLTDDEIRPRVQIPDTGEKVGLGWFIKEVNGKTMYGHEGADIGFRSSFWLCPENDIRIVLIANISGAPLKKMSEEIFNNLT